MIPKELKVIFSAHDINLKDFAAYKYRPTNCWSCGQKTILWRWCETPYFDGLMPQPIPPNLQYMPTTAHPKPYWANICLECSAVQGDRWLFFEERDATWLEV